jgi:transposase
MSVRSPQCAERHREIIAAYESGLPLRSVAKRFGMSLSWTHKLIAKKKPDIMRGRGYRSPAELRQIRHDTVRDDRPRIFKSFAT